MYRKNIVQYTKNLFFFLLNRTDIKTSVPDTESELRLKMNENFCCLSVNVLCMGLYVLVCINVCVYVCFV